MNKPILILGIAGSLRRESYNRAAVRAATKLVPEGAAIETFERAAVDFVSNFKAEGGSSPTAADPGPAPAPEKVAADSANKQRRLENLAIFEESTAAAPVWEPAPTPKPTAAKKSSSRWRMRLNTREGQS